MTALLDLPAEILIQIVSLLCPHCIVISRNLGQCTCQEERPKDGKRFTASDLLRLDLARLSRTCRALRDIAQPVLYHSPKPVVGYELLLARTLAKRRDLAFHVKELHLGRWSVDEKDVTPELQDLFNGIIVEVGVPPSLLGETSKEWPKDWFLNGAENKNPYVGFIPDITKGSDASEFFNNRVRVVDALMVTLVSNVEHIHLLPLSVPSFPFCAPGSLPRLTDLTFQVSNQGEGSSIDCVKGILDAAPALERIRGLGINGMSTAVTHPNLRSLDLNNSALGATHLQAIMNGFPKLQVFGYEVDTHIDVGSPDARDAIPREIGEALLIRKDTLKDVDLDLARSSMYRHNSRLSPEDAMPSLNEMEVLEELAVDREAIFVTRDMMPEALWVQIDDDGIGNMVEGGEVDNEIDEMLQALMDPDDRRRKKDLIVDFLPPSIRSFKLYDRHGKLFPDLIKLATETPEKFPNLKKVRFWGFNEDQRMALRGSFRRAGVKCFHGGYL
ncbi:hypothetical protein CGCS363_v000243 [Colletotrichum siamense]|uniref:uncharacterized protein n=1 Tax=Colletotrichum siamense TaxID=690259 RepID=UPI0018726DC2|nr:uncharacterized protein CGCS363_v000243 [Colletotrichum siamense]KAF5516832.1 hypothetical protein CGCS363_v000243 [Colletotrichum siamense]